MTSEYLHPDCPDTARLGPTAADAALRAKAARVEADLAEADDGWRRGFTRRAFVATAGMAGVAALGSQYVTTKVAFADPATSNGNTVVVMFLRGGCDGLHLLVPASDALGVAEYRKARPNIALPAGKLKSLSGGWALNAAMAKLLPLYQSGELAFIPAVATDEVSRSHFQAQDFYECGGPPAQARNGWLDRVLEKLGPGTTFRAISEGTSLPRSMAGNQSKIVLSGVQNFAFPGAKQLAAPSKKALDALYRGIDHPLTSQVRETLSALATAEKIAAKPYEPGADYGEGHVGRALMDVARLVKANVGLQVATVDVGGFDTHTDEVNQLEKIGTSLAGVLSAFLTDLGPLRKKVTLVAMTEFGRRVGQNANGGTDHGHGAVMFAAGGGVAGGKVHGKWPGLGKDDLDHGDVAGVNQAFDVLGELVTKRLGVGSLSTVFPGHTYKPMGIFRA